MNFYSSEEMSIMLLNKKSITIFTLIAGLGLSLTAMATTPNFDNGKWAKLSTLEQSNYIVGELSDQSYLNIYSSRKSSDQRNRVNWAVLTTQTFSNSPGTDDALVRHYLKISTKKVKRLTNLLSLVDWNNKTVLREEYLCDTNGYSVSFVGTQQHVIDSCGSSSLPLVTSEMKRATNILMRIKETVKTLGKIAP